MQLRQYSINIFQLFYCTCIVIGTDAAKIIGATNLQVTRHILKNATWAIKWYCFIDYQHMVSEDAITGTLVLTGDIAIRKGYQAYDISYLVVTSIVLIVIVQLVQGIGNVIYKKKA